MLSKSLKKLYKKVYKRNHRRVREDGLADSLLYAARTVTDRDNDEGWKDFGFILPEDIVYDYDPEMGEWATYLDLTDAEINQWIDEHMYVRIHSEWDCTGRPFTVNITWHRNPCGLISYVHTMACDV